jgi:Zn finger protein HypA/HybF involved in hydrogenase expression
MTTTTQPKQPLTETAQAECLRCGLTAEREVVIGATEHDGKRAIDGCPRCGSHDARWL